MGTSLGYLTKKIITVFSNHAETASNSGAKYNFLKHFFTFWTIKMNASLLTYHARSTFHKSESMSKTTLKNRWLVIRQAVLKPPELPLDEMADVRCKSQPLVESRCGKSHGKDIFHTARSLHSHSFFLFQCIFLEEFFLVTICTSADGKSFHAFKIFSLT